MKETSHSSKDGLIIVPTRIIADNVDAFWAELEEHQGGVALAADQSSARESRGVALKRGAVFFLKDRISPIPSFG